MGAGNVQLTSEVEWGGGTRNVQLTSEVEWGGGTRNVKLTSEVKQAREQSTSEVKCAIIMEELKYGVIIKDNIKYEGTSYRRYALYQK